MNKDNILPWTKEPFPESVRKEAESALEKLEKGESSPETEGFAVPLEFGTGGMRGIIGNGIGRMNVYTVARAALGLCRYLNLKFKNPTIVIAYDSRRMSKEFAEITAATAAREKIKVKLFGKPTPTPMLSYAVRHYKAQGGVVITASHNPPEYNGFKAYLNDGGQLVPPDDAKIISSIEKIKDWSQVSGISKKSKEYAKYVSAVDAKVFDTYKKKVLGSGIYNSKMDPKLRSKLKVVYSPLHGTGGDYMKSLLNQAGYKNVFLVPEQAKPDGEFPTVQFPNPEEKEALVLSEAFSKKKNADIFIATDPDADRLGIGVRNSEGNYVLLNGNQTGSILCAYLCEKISAAPKTDKIWHIFKTIVTTDLQENIAKKNKVKIKNVLTGFKYIANEMNKIEKNPKNKFLFGGEESYGYLPVDIVRDKDSLSSALLLLEVIAEKKDILSYLNEIYVKYGLYLESLKSISLKGEAGKTKIKESIDRLRKENLIGRKIGTREVIGVLDYQMKTAKGSASKSVFAGMPPSNVIQVILSGNAKLTIRPSGTEPKVKIYSSFQSLNSPASVADLPELQTSLRTEILEAEKQFISMAGLDG